MLRLLHGQARSDVASVCAPGEHMERRLSRGASSQFSDCRAAQAPSRQRLGADAASDPGQAHRRSSPASRSRTAATISATCASISSFADSWMRAALSSAAASSCATS